MNKKLFPAFKVCMMISLELSQKNRFLSHFELPCWAKSVPGVPGNEKFAARINYFTGGAARNLSARRASIYFAERTLKRCNAFRVSLVVIDDVVLPMLDHSMGRARVI